MNGNPAWITCPCCHLTSYNRNDIEEQYCGRCKMFHADMPAARPTGRPHEFATPGSKCPSCAHPFDVGITASGIAPVRGTLSVCMQCGEAAIYVDPVTVQPLTAEVLDHLALTSPSLYSMLREMQRLVRRDVRPSSAGSSPSS